MYYHAVCTTIASFFFSLFFFKKKEKKPKKENRQTRGRSHIQLVLDKLCTGGDFDFDSDLAITLI